MQGSQASQRGLEWCEHRKTDKPTGAVKFFSGGVREKSKTYSMATGEKSESVLSATSKKCWAFKESDGKLFSTGGLPGTRAPKGAEGIM